MLKIGSKVMVHSYKHNGLLYRSWESPIVIYENEDYIVLLNTQISIYEIDKKPRTARDRALWFLYKKKWYNFIAMFKNDDFQLYVNIASPYIYEENAIKYVDYDLDFKMLINRKWKLLDQKDFDVNSISMGYDSKTIAQIEKATKEVENCMIEAEMPVTREEIKSIYRNYYVNKMIMKRDLRNKKLKEELANSTIGKSDEE
jgi:protein associated with RNAse G/E